MCIIPSSVMSVLSNESCLRLTRPESVWEGEIFKVYNTMIISNILDPATLVTDWLVSKSNYESCLSNYYYSTVPVCVLYYLEDRPCHHL